MKPEYEVTGHFGSLTGSVYHSEVEVALKAATSLVLNLKAGESVTVRRLSESELVTIEGEVKEEDDDNQVP